MGIGRVRISNALIASVLSFPVDWVIESIEPAEDFINGMTSIATISGTDFPSLKRPGDEPRMCMMKVFKESLHYEVEEES